MKASILFVALVAASALSLLAPAVVAAADFAGSYSDPNHANCLRNIALVGNEKASITGTDGDPDCPPDGSGNAWSLEGTIEGDSILIDFSPKGGPKDLLGTWEQYPPGIRFQDGNKWTKIIRPTMEMAADEL